MKKYVLSHSKQFLTIISVYEMLGGVIGLFVVYRFINPDLEAGAYIALVPLATLFFLSLIAGILRFKQGKKNGFYVLSKLNFCLQIMQMVLTGFTFIYFYSPYIGIGFDGDLNFI